MGLAPNINLHKTEDVDAKTGAIINYYEILENTTNEPEHFVIVAHGNIENIVDELGYPVSSEELAEMIIKNGYNFDKPIYIYACEVGMKTGPTSYVQKTADYLGKYWLKKT